MTSLLVMRILSEKPPSVLCGSAPHYLMLTAVVTPQRPLDWWDTVRQQRDSLYKYLKIL